MLYAYYRRLVIASVIALLFLGSQIFLMGSLFYPSRSLTLLDPENSQQNSDLSDATFINTLHSEIQIAQDGRAFIRETVEVISSGKTISEGLYRSFTTNYQDILGRRYQSDISHFQLTRDSYPQPIFSQNTRNGLRLYIINAGKSISPGTYTFILSYQVDRQLRRNQTSDEFFWNFTDSPWSCPVVTTTTTLQLPEAVRPDQLTLSLLSAEKPVASTTVHTSFLANGLTLQSPSLQKSDQGLTLLLDWPKGIVATADPLKQIDLFITFNRQLVISLLAVVMLSFLYYLIWLRLGSRSLSRRKQVIGTPPLMPVLPSNLQMQGIEVTGQEAPPNLADPSLADLEALRRATEISPLPNENLPLTPAACRYIHNQAADLPALAATFLSLLQRAILTYTQSEEIYQLSLPSEAILRGNQLLMNTTKHFLTPEEACVINRLTLNGNQVRLSTRSDRNADTLRSQFNDALAQQYETIIFNQHTNLLIFAILTSLGLSWYIFQSHFGLISSSLLIGSLFLANLIFGYSLRGYTALGRQLLQEIQDFRNYLGITSLKRTHPSPTPPQESYLAYLPYALALDVGYEWESRFPTLPLEVKNQAQDLKNIYTALLHFYKPTISREVGRA